MLGGPTSRGFCSRSLGAGIVLICAPLAVRLYARELSAA